jgi:threonine-phosphate decarboxylase
MPNTLTTLKTAAEEKHPQDSLPAIAIDRKHGGAAERGTIDFSASINPLGPPPGAVAEYHRAVESLSRYPDPFPFALAKEVARWVGVAADQVLVGNGSTQLIHLLARAMEWRRPVVVTPTFSEIANALIVNGHNARKAAGAAPLELARRDEIAVGYGPLAIELSPSRGFELRIEDVTIALENGADAIFIGRPNSPTGSMLTFETATAIALECARCNADCVFDEAFIDFADNARSMIDLIDRAPNVTVLRSLTKIFAIPGLRLGFAVSAASTNARLREMIEPWSVNAVAERVGLACLDGAAEFIARTRELIAAERDSVLSGLGQNPNLRVFPSAANFLMIAARETGGKSFGEFMMRRGIVVRDLKSLPGAGAGLYRIGIRNHDDNRRLVAAAREF